MKKFVHWLKIDGYCDLKDTAKQFSDIENYLAKYKTSKAKIYQYNSGSYNWVVRLECNQCYDDLDLTVNSGSSRLIHFTSKPQNIGREQNFYFPEHYRRFL